MLKCRENFLVHFLGCDLGHSIPPTIPQLGNARRVGGTLLPAAFHGRDSGRAEKQKDSKDRGGERMKAEEERERREVKGK